ncbi:hypothetical protein ACFYUJ_34360 [Streptomyces sp. NPDC004520]|uniref:hypothetical protein n=1 Tax=Streptomyces sp. NPDC004520 TaxID=3364702 RepID=UPI0036915126
MHDRAARCIRCPAHPAAADVPVLAAIRATPEVRARWRGGEDLAAEVVVDLADPEVRCLTVRHQDRIIGMIQGYSEEEPDYRHAGDEQSGQNAGLVDPPGRDSA